MTFCGKVFLYWVLILGVPLALTGQDKTNIKAVELVEQLTIGGKTSKSTDYNLGNIKDIAVDRERNIYIADAMSMSINVFSREGEYVNSIGRRGRGPGEFLSFKEITVSNKNELLVVDKRQFRIIKFNTSGELLETYSMSAENQDVVFFNQISQLKDGKNLVLYKKFGSVGSDEEVFHIWDDGFENKLKSFGAFGDLGFDEGFGKEIVKLALGSFTFKNEQQIIFAPSIYQGNLFLYDKTNSGDWKFNKKVEGHNFEIKPYENYSSSRSNDALTLHTQQGEVNGDINVSSMGVFSLGKNYIAHFSMSKANKSENKKWVFGVELYDNKLNFLGYFKLDTFAKSHNLIQPGLRAKDADDNFYMLIKQDTYPIVRKFSLDIVTE
jgi:hypothetical protein